MEKHKHYYLNLFFYITIAIVLTILIFSVIFYIQSENIISKQIYSYTDTSLGQLSQDVDNINKSLKQACVILYSDRYLQKFLYATQPTDIDIINGLDQLENYRFITNFIRSIYLYNNTTKTFYLATRDSTNLIKSKDEFFDKEIENILEHYPYNERLIPIPRKIPARDPALTANGEFYGYDGYSYVYLDSFDNKMTNSAVVVNIPETLFLNTIKKSDNAFHSTTMMIDKNGKLMINTNNRPVGANLSSESFVARVLASEEAKGRFTEEVDGEKAFIAYYAPAKNGWRYISVTPYSEITRGLKDLRNKTVLISLSILGLGILISLLISKKLYTPVKQMATSITTLESEQRNSFYTLRQECLRSIVLEYNNMDGTVLQNKLQKFQIKLDTESRIVAILFKIDRYQDFCRRYSAQDKSLMKFAVMNIASELLQAKFPNEAVEMGDTHVLLVGYLKDQEFTVQDEGFVQVLKDIQAAVAQHMNLSVSVAVSPVEESMDDVTYLYYKVLEDSFQTIFYGQQCIIFSENIRLMEEQDFDYQLQLEKYLLDSLMLGNIEDAKRRYEKIIEYISGFSYTSINMAFSHLVFNIKTSLNTLQKNNFPDVQLNFNSVLSLNEYENIEDINNDFFKAFEAVAEKLDEKKNRKHAELIQKINTVIQTRYSNQTLSIDYIAEEMGYTANYIGRLYKKITHQTIPDMISAERLKQATKLLSETDMQIARISELTGFTTDGCFYKAFKKENGITPNEYRKTFGKSYTG